MKLKQTKSADPVEAQTKLKLSRDAAGKTHASLVVLAEGHAAQACHYVLDDCDELTAVERKAVASVWRKLEARALAELGLAVAEETETAA